MSSCRLCGVGELDLFLDLPRSLSNISRLSDCSNNYKGRVVHLKVWKCGYCGFVQLTESLPRDFYGDYIMGTSYTKKIKRLQDLEASILRSAFKVDGELSVIDVGCGDGEFLYSLEKFNFVVCGTEPSKVFRNKVAKRFTVFDEYVHSDTSLGPYDAVTAREVLEHVWDIRSFVQGLRKVLVPGGFGLIEVPRLEKAIEGNRFYDFFADHVNYFSVETLSLLLHLNGFVDVRVVSVMDDEYNLAVFRKPIEVCLFPEKVLKSIRELFSDESREYVFWGTGGKGLSILTALGVTPFKFVVDDDPEKQNKKVPISDLSIREWDHVRRVIKEDSVIIISAMAYFDEILDKIRSSNFKGAVYGIGKEGVFRV